MVWTVNVPSVEAKVFSSRTKNMEELTKRAPAPQRGRVGGGRGPSTFSSMATSKGSISIGERQRPSGMRLHRCQLHAVAPGGGVGARLRHRLARHPVRLVQA
jgi:hypothetical protein